MKTIVEDLGFVVFYSSKIGNMESVYGIHNNVPSMIKKDGKTMLFGNVTLQVYKIGDLPISYALSICKMVKEKYSREFRQKDSGLLFSIQYTDIQTDKEKITKAIHDFHKSYKV